MSKIFLEPILYLKQYLDFVIGFFSGALRKSKAEIIMTISDDVIMHYTANKSWYCIPQVLMME